MTYWKFYLCATFNYHAWVMKSMKKSEALDALYDRVGTLYDLTKGQLDHILKELNIVCLEGLERDGEVYILKMGKFFIKKAPPRRVTSKYVRGGTKTLDERDVLDFSPNSTLKTAVSSGDFTSVMNNLRLGKKRSW